MLDHIFFAQFHLVGCLAHTTPNLILLKISKIHPHR
jgi:hypothetical protein